MNSFIQEYGRTIVTVIIVLAFVVFGTVYGDTITGGIGNIANDFFNKSGVTVVNEETEEAGGLYDASGNQIASWDELINDYGLDVECDYGLFSTNNYQTTSTSPYYILNNYNELSVGTRLVIPNGSIDKIGKYAFKRCTSLEEIVFPNDLITIEMQAFEGCTGLTSVSVPNSVTKIGTSAFAGCSSIGTLQISNNVSTIEQLAFGDCDGLESVTLPNSVTKINQQAFDGCDNLATITIPTSVTFIGGNIFSDCIDLHEIKFLGTKQQWEDIEKGSYWNKNSSVTAIKCSDGTIMP